MRPSIIFCIPPVTGHTRRSRVCRVPKISPPPEIAAKPAPWQLLRLGFDPAAASFASWPWLAVTSTKRINSPPKKKQVLINYKVLPYDQEPRSGSYWPSARVVLWVHARMMVDAAKKGKPSQGRKKKLRCNRPPHVHVQEGF